MARHLQRAAHIHFIMTTMRTSIQLFLFMLPLMFIAAFWSGCSGSSDHEGPVGTARMEEGTIDADGNSEADKAQAQKETRPSGKMTDSDKGTMGASADVDEEDKADPERERAVQEVQDLRDGLAEELEKVRERLRDGSHQGEERQMDQRRAAELGQTLASLQRKAERIANASEEEWAKIREEARKEVEEVRAKADRDDKDRS